MNARGTETECISVPRVGGYGSTLTMVLPQQPSYPATSVLLRGVEVRRPDFHARGAFHGRAERLLILLRCRAAHPAVVIGIDDRRLERLRALRRFFRRHR